ncbi:hypothetical protein [Hyalangium versicolor]|uniref:hypothetical protein n=1 Tax=Hyalangium versicolor TaxID=2861190 RepID=UPI001CC9DC9F|nr:hypothetical protein [Hyalangium versicolor]
MTNPATTSELALFPVMNRGLSLFVQVRAFTVGLVAVVLPSALLLLVHGAGPPF